jgi:hypothetical protein
MSTTGGADEWVIAARPIASDAIVYASLLPQYIENEAQVLLRVGDH